MSKYDCSKCLDYSHEHQRMCEVKHTEIEGCGGCELYRYSTLFLYDFSSILSL